MSAQQDIYTSLYTYLVSLGCPETDMHDIDLELMLAAFTHKSYAMDDVSQHIAFNERLEFLGDSMLGACVAQHLYADFPHMPESKMTLSKIHLVREETLADCARSIGLGPYIRLGRGEIASNGQEKDSVLSDAMEAVIGYVYVQRGRDVVDSLVHSHIYTQMDPQSALTAKSPKNQLQELVQGEFQEVPEYRDFEHKVEKSGNVLVFGTHIYVQNRHIASGYGPSKKKAHIDAAQLAIQKLSKAE